MTEITFRNFFVGFVTIDLPVSWGIASVNFLLSTACYLYTVRDKRKTIHLDLTTNKQWRRYLFFGYIFFTLPIILILVSLKYRNVTIKN